MHNLVGDAIELPSSMEEDTGFRPLLIVVMK